jgi:DNA repair protein RadC
MIIKEKATYYGTQSLSDRELIEGILGETATEKAFDKIDVSRILKMSFDEFVGLGLTKTIALKLSSIGELVRRSKSDSFTDALDSPKKVIDLMRARTNSLEIEKFWTICLDRKNKPIGVREVTSGTASSCLVHPRETFRSAISLGASAVIVCHNHPSGDPVPSRADIQVTRQLRESAKILGIDLLDHIIIGERDSDPQGLGFYSFNEAGLI